MQVERAGHILLVRSRYPPRRTDTLFSLSIHSQCNSSFLPSYHKRSFPSSYHKRELVLPLRRGTEVSGGVPTDVSSGVWVPSSEELRESPRVP